MARPAGTSRRRRPDRLVGRVVEALSRVARDAASDDRLAAMSAAARQRALDHYSAAAVGPRYRQIVRGVARRPAATSPGAAA